MKLRGLAYGVFFFICLALGLVYRFPESLARQWLQDHLTPVDGAVVTLENFSLALPAGFKAHRLHMAGRGFPGMDLEMPRVQLGLGRLLTGRLAASFQGRLHGGGVSGRIAESENNGDRMILEARLDQVAPAVELGRELALLNGNWSGGFTLEMDGKTVRLIQGEWSLEQGVLTLGRPRGGIGRIQFTQGRMGIRPGKDGAVAVETFSITGPHLDLNLTGNVIPGFPLGGTRLDLWGQLTLHPLYFMDGGQTRFLGLSGNRSQGRPINVKIGGTIDRPEISPAEER